MAISAEGVHHGRTNIGSALILYASSVQSKDSDYSPLPLDKAYKVPGVRVLYFFDSCSLNPYPRGLSTNPIKPKP